MATSPVPTPRSFTNPPPAPCRPHKQLRTGDMVPVSLDQPCLFDRTKQTWLGTVRTYEEMGGEMRIQVPYDVVVVSSTTCRVVDPESSLFDHELVMGTPFSAASS